MQKEFQLAVDIESKIRTPSFEVNTLDLKTVKLLITIIRDMSLVDLTGITVRMSIQKPDKNVLFQECKVINAKAGLVEIVLDNQAYLLPGKYNAELMCFQGSDVVAVTGSFSYTSTKGILTDEAVESKSEFTAITGMIANTQKTLDDLRKNGTGIDAEARKGVETVNGKLAQTADYTLYPQSPKPEKSGVKQTTYKITHKVNDTALDVIQRTNKGYVLYNFTKNTGGNVEGRDYGVNHQLLRLTGARPMVDCYVYKNASSPKSGSFSSVYAAPGQMNQVESLLLHLPDADINKNKSSNNGLGVGCYVIAPNTEVTYEMAISASKRGNVLLLCSSGSSSNMLIKVNGITTKTFNAKPYVTADGTASLAQVDFDLPIQGSTNKKANITIRNEASEGVIYLVALNFFKLKDYNGEDITDYKAFGSTKGGWIENTGASDYAIADENNLWFGSYHGGEVLEYDRILWNSGSVVSTDYNLSQKPFADITAGEWKVQKNLQVFQQTDLANGKAKMTSNVNFDTDGSLEMEFSYYKGQVKLKTFYTALTSTSVAFDYLMQPEFHFFGNTPSGNKHQFPLSEGRISQVNSASALQLDIRFTKFNNFNDSQGAHVLDSTAYRKFYYGPLQASSPTLINALTFSKGLDFIVR